MGVTTSVAIASFLYQVKLTSPDLGKKSQLEEVMEKETYKNAKLILERFDPEAKKRAVSANFSLYHLFFFRI